MRDNGKAKALLPLLRHDHPVYGQRSTNAVIRIRGYLMAAFAQTGLPANAVGELLAELDSAHSPYLVAGAAIGLRGVRKPDASIMSALLNAIHRMQYGDDAVCFEQFKPDWQRHVGKSALTELLLSVEKFSVQLPIPAKDLQQLTTKVRVSADGRVVCNRIADLQRKREIDSKASDDCCGQPLPRRRKFLSASRSFKGIRVQDQEGQYHLLSDLMNNKPTLLTFFYTRCDNVYRCSLTITRLGRLQKVLQQAGITREVQLLAISFDAAYDLPFRMGAFAHHRGFRCHEQASCVRVDSGMEHLLGCLQPGVNFNDGLVNQHAVTFFLFDRSGFLKRRFSSTAWDEEQLCKDLVQLRHQKTTFYERIRHTTQACLSIGYSVVLAFFPKCPLCAAAYLSAFGISSAGLMQYHRLLLPVLGLLLGWHLQAVARRAWRRNWYLPLVCSLAGAFCVGWSAIGVPGNWWSYAGIFLVGVGSLLNGWERTGKKIDTMAIGTPGWLFPSMLFQKRKI
jgi:protein SCO1/2